MKNLFFVFDVESIGLHGDAFAVGFVVVDSDGTEIACANFACDPQVIAVFPEGADYEWVVANTPKMDVCCDSIGSLIWKFWAEWMKWKELGAVMAADCPWPVESSFLSKCIEYNPEERRWNGPYPLIDVASVVLASGGDPTGIFGRLPSELPKHSPVRDARQSARIMIEALRKIQSHEH